MGFRRSTVFILVSSLALASVSFACNFFGQLSNKDSEPLYLATGLPDLSTATETTIPIPATQAPAEPPPTSNIPATDAPITLPLVVTNCDDEICFLEGLYLASRPIGPDGRYTVNPATRFGEFQRSKNDANHGSYFLNSTGTPVIAAADGVVVFAGEDTRNAFVNERRVLGKLVLLQHTLPGYDQPVFTLYGHLSKIKVETNQEVKAGQEIGRSGSSGNVRGSTLYFEVRLGENSYASAYNPELFLPPVGEQDLGILAGRITDAQGEMLKIDNLVIELLGTTQEETKKYYLKTYSHTKLAGREPYKENFAIGDLPAGKYKISFWADGYHSREVEVQPRKITLIVIKVE